MGMANCKGWKPIKPAVVCAAGEKPASEEFGFMQTPMGANSKLFSDATGIYLKGKYIELGIDKKGGGRYGANYSKLPAGFFGRQGGRKKIGMVGDGDGFGVGKDLRIDYFPRYPRGAFPDRLQRQPQGPQLRQKL